MGSWSYPGRRRKHSVWSWAALPLFIISPWRPTPTAQARAQALVLQLELRCQTRASCGTSSRGASGAALLLWPLGGPRFPGPTCRFSPAFFSSDILRSPSYPHSSPASSRLQWREAQGHVGGSFRSGLRATGAGVLDTGTGQKILSQKNSISKRSRLLNCSVFCPWSS